jgi:hypothetical protein
MQLRISEVSMSRVRILYDEKSFNILYTVTSRLKIIDIMTPAFQRTLITCIQVAISSLIKFALLHFEINLNGYKPLIHHVEILPEAIKCLIVNACRIPLCNPISQKQC